jgi:hypothetical protein
MIEDLEIVSFRGLGGIALTRLARVNVIVGPNASGKTALLEALTLGCRASPQTALTMWQGRAQSQFVPMGTAGFQAVWARFFRHTGSFDDLEAIIVATDADDHPTVAFANAQQQVRSTAKGLVAPSAPRIEGSGRPLVSVLLVPWVNKPVIWNPSAPLQPPPPSRGQPTAPISSRPARAPT